MMPPKPSGERGPAVSSRDESNVTGGWLPSLTLIVEASPSFQTALEAHRGLHEEEPARRD